MLKSQVECVTPDSIEIEKRLLRRKNLTKLVLLLFLVGRLVSEVITQ